MAIKLETCAPCNGSGYPTDDSGNPVYGTPCVFCNGNGKRMPGAPPVIDPKRILKGIQPDADTDARARRASETFNRMIPMMNAFAKMITGRNDVRVVAYGGGACTDGTTIFMRPPIELGDRFPHETMLCDLRDEETDSRLCRACRASEDVLITLYHEISHIAFDSFDEVSDEDKAALIENAVKEAVLGIETARETVFAAIAKAREDGDTELEAALIYESRRLAIKLGTREEKIAARLAKMPVKGYMEAAAAVSPYLPMMVNALEDVRVNHRMYQTRPGTYAMFRGQAIRIFSDGIQNDDGTFRLWKDMPRNAQMMVALLAKAAGYEEYRNGWFRDDVIEALDDPDLCVLLNKVPTLGGAADIYRLAFPVLERVRKLGFCRAKEDLDDDEVPVGTGKPVKPAEPDGEGEGDEEAEGEGAGEGGGVPEDDDESEPTTGAGSSAPTPDKGDSDDATDDAGEGDDSDSDDATDPTAGEGDDATDETDDAGEGTGDDETDDDAGEGEGEGTGDDSDSDDAADPTDEPDSGGIGWEGEEDATGPGRPSDIPEDADADAEETEDAVKRFGGHGPIPMTPEKEAEEIAIDRAIEQADVFDAPSRNVFGVKVHRWDRHCYAADGTDLSEQLAWNPYTRRYYGGGDLEKTPETLLGPSLVRLRAVFAHNKRFKTQRNLDSGTLDRAVLGRRIATGDDRLFMTKRYPGKKDYFVVIGLDLSGSTASGAITLIKQAGLAQAELLSRLGIKFAMYGHTGSLHDGGAYRGDGLDVDIFVVKEINEPWDHRCKERLGAFGPASANLDGHTLEFYRKVCDQSRATDKIIMYYTDGAMPCENRKEELTILQRELKHCNRVGYTVMGVGVGTDSPTQHGLDTVRIDGMGDLMKVVRHLEKRVGVKRAS